MIGAGEDARDHVERLLVALVVDGDDAHLLRHGDHGDGDLAGDTLGSAVTGSGLVGRNVRVGHEMDVRSRHAGAVGGEDDRAIHLRQLGQPLGRELGVEEEAARADIEDLGPIADDDERPHLRLQNAVDPFSERRARRDEAQGPEKSFRSAWRQRVLQVGSRSETEYEGTKP